MLEYENRLELFQHKQHWHTYTHTPTVNVNKETVKFTTLTSQFTICLIIKDNNVSVQSLKSSQIMFVDMIS